MLLLIGLIGGLLLMSAGCSIGSFGVVVVVVGAAAAAVGSSSVCAGLGPDRIAVGVRVRLCSCSCLMIRGMLLLGWVCGIQNIC